MNIFHLQHLNTRSEFLLKSIFHHNQHLIEFKRLILASYNPPLRHIHQLFIYLCFSFGWSPQRETLNINFSITLNINFSAKSEFSQLFSYSSGDDGSESWANVISWKRVEISNWREGFSNYNFLGNFKVGYWKVGKFIWTFIWIDQFFYNFIPIKKSS